MYSDSHDEAATALSLKDDHEMGVCQEVKIQPPRDAKVSLSPAQSESASIRITSSKSPYRKISTQRPYFARNLQSARSFSRARTSGSAMERRASFTENLIG